MSWLLELVLIWRRHRLLPFLILKSSEETSRHSGPPGRWSRLETQLKSMALSPSEFYWCEERLKQIRTAEDPQQKTWMRLKVKEHKQRFLEVWTFVEKAWRWTVDKDSCSLISLITVFFFFLMDFTFSSKSQISVFYDIQRSSDCLCLYHGDKEQLTQECCCRAKLNTANPPLSLVLRRKKKKIANNLQNLGQKREKKIPQVTP